MNAIKSSEDCSPRRPRTRLKDTRLFAGKCGNLDKPGGIFSKPKFDKGRMVKPDKPSLREKMAERKASKAADQVAKERRYAGPRNL
jgi:hypothetical protein